MRTTPPLHRARATLRRSSRAAMTPGDRSPGPAHDGVPRSSKSASQEEQSPPPEINWPERSGAARCRHRVDRPRCKTLQPACPAIGSDRNSTREAQIDRRPNRRESFPLLLFDSVEQFFDFADLGRRGPLEAQQLQDEFSHRAAKGATEQIAHHLPLGVSFCQPRAKNLRLAGFLTIEQSLLTHDLHELESRRMSDGGPAICF